MQSSAKTVAGYLKELPPDRRAAISAVRKVILKSLPRGYKEQMGYGMIGYVVPLTLYPAGYLNNKTQPLPFAGLASQKQNMAVYLMCTYGNKKLDAWFRAAYRATGKKLDMGKSCVRFRTLDDLPLPLIGQVIRRVPVRDFIRMYEASRT